MKTAIQQMMTAIEKEMPRLLNTSTSDGRKFIDLVYPYFVMEKEQIIFSNFNGQSVGKSLLECDVYKFKNKAEQYYNETFKSE